MKTDTETDNLVRKHRRRREIKFRKYNDPNRPNLKFVVGYREAGKRKRSFFETKDAAKSFVSFKNAELKQNGVEHAEFPTSLRLMAQEAMEKLRPFKKSITDAVDHYVAHLEANKRSCTAQQLVSELLKAKAKDDLSDRHLNTLESRLGYFARHFDGRLVAEITAADIDDWLRSLGVGPVTRNHYRTAAYSAFKFAVKRRYATANPVEETDKVKEPSGEIGILTINQTANLIESAPSELVPYIAIGAFAGLRPSEIMRLEWSDILFDSDLIRVEALKGTRKHTRRRRFVKILPNLREWLLPFRKVKSSVAPQDNFRELFDAARETAGVLDEWPENALRHGYGSYHLAHFKDEKALALEMGNSPDVIFARYRERVTPGDAARYWKIRPQTRGKKIVPLVVAR